jgi:hypothetical protein
MSDEKESPKPAAPTPADPVKDATVFDEFAKQASKTAVWSDAAKAQLPKKEK